MVYSISNCLGAKVVLSKKEFIFFPPPPLGYITKGLMLLEADWFRLKGGCSFAFTIYEATRYLNSALLDMTTHWTPFYFQLSGWYRMSCLLMLVAYSVIGQVYDLPSFRKPAWVIEIFFIIFLYRRSIY